MSSIAVRSGYRQRWRRTPVAASIDPATDAAADQAFATLYRAHAPAIYRYFARRLGVQAAEDLTADTFAAALGAIARFDSDRGPELPWLYGIAANILSNHRRAEVRHLRALAAQGSETVDFGYEDDVLGRVTAAAQHRAVAAAVADLPAFDREALLLIAWDELSYAQAAQVLGCSVAHVRSRLHEARTALRRRVQATTKDQS